MIVNIGNNITSVDVAIIEGQPAGSALGFLGGVSWSLTADSANVNINNFDRVVGIVANVDATNVEIETIAVSATVEPVSPSLVTLDIPSVVSVSVSEATAVGLQGPKGDTGEPGLLDTFETISQNLPSNNSVLNYNQEGLLTSIEYSDGTHKTLTYVDGFLVQITLAPATLSNISLNKNLEYDANENLIGISYN